MNFSFEHVFPNGNRKESREVMTEEEADVELEKILEKPENAFLKKRLKESLDSAPLGSTELRGIRGVGGHYFSKMPTHDSKEHLFAADVDGETLYVYKVPVV